VETALLWARAFAYLRRLTRRYGSRFTLRVPGHPPLVFVSDPDGVAAILSEREAALSPGKGAAAVAPIVGERSFMLAHGAEHAAAREALLAALNAKQVQRHAEAIEALARRAVASWPVGEPIALHPRLRALCLEATLRLLLGCGQGPLDGEAAALHEAVLAMLEVTSRPLLTERYLRACGPGRRAWRRFLADRARVDAILLALIRARVEGPTVEGPRAEDLFEGPRAEDLFEGPPQEDLLDVLCKLRNADGSPSSPEQVRDNAMSLILAGHETTAAQLAWAFQLLAHHPHAQQRLTADLDGGEHERYLEATVQETLRHRCVFVFGIPRELVAPVEIDGETYDPPAQLLPCIHLLHHDPKRFREPERFMPERFLDAPPDPRAWLPWGGGRRRCPGVHLATLELRAVLRAVLASRDVLPAATAIERPRWRSVIVTPHAGGRVILRERGTR
jgi:cytochrome P450